MLDDHVHCRPRLGLAGHYQTAPAAELFVLCKQKLQSIESSQRCAVLAGVIQGVAECAVVSHNLQHCFVDLLLLRCNDTCPIAFSRNRYADSPATGCSLPG
jgi:hypothetical protein